MEDEERQKKLEAGKAKVRELEAVRPALGGGGWEGLGGGLGSGDLSSPGAPPREGGAAGSAFSPRLLSLF